MHDTVLEAIAALRENDVPATLTRAQEEHVALSDLVRRPDAGADRGTSGRHLLDDDGGEGIALQTPFHADVYFVELDSPLAAARAAARPNLNDSADHDEWGSPDELREVAGDGARRGSG